MVEKADNKLLAYNRRMPQIETVRASNESYLIIRRGWARLRTRILREMRSALRKRIDSEEASEGKQGLVREEKPPP